MTCPARAALLGALITVAAPGLSAVPAGSGEPFAVLTHRRGLEAVVRYQRSRPDLFPETKLAGKRLLPREEKEAVWSVWKSFLDYELALDSLGHAHHDFWKRKGAERERSLLVLYGALAARYRFAMAFIERAENDPSLDVFLNEPVPELGLPRGTFAALKLRFLNAARATEFAALEATLRAAGGVAEPALRAAIREDAAEIWRIGKTGTGGALTAKNALSVTKGAGFAAWFPVQAGVAEWMGDVKVWRRHRSLITDAQIRESMPKLEPGDVFLERREWYLSNIGLPGFWPHAVLYIGTGEERRAVFGNDAGVKAFVSREGRTDGDFEALLLARFPAAYATSAAPFEGHVPRCLEAISEGVTFTSLEHSASSDAWAVLRPRLPKEEKARAILRAFSLAGRPYDFDFDFLTDDAIVCSELVSKAYAPGDGAKGLTFPLIDVLGRKATPPNDIVRQWTEQEGTPAQQTDLVLFLDGHEKQGRAVPAGVAEFRESWRRPKWHVFEER